ncbi:MAG TPA: RsmE family RNA methyltransferase [Byssovorax sp.]
MTRRLLRVPVEAPGDGERALPDDAAIYVTRVHRLGVGARFVAFDPALGVEADGELVRVDRRSVIARLGAQRASRARPAREVTLVQGVAKGDKLDAVVRDATELGATRVVPAIAERSVRRPERGKAARLDRIALEAARQCGRGDVPVVDPVCDLAEVWPRFAPRGDALAVVLDADGEAPLGALFAALAEAAPVVIVVGPEGGVSPAELELARAHGFVAARLGAFVMRTETACAAALGALLAAHRDE